MIDSPRLERSASLLLKGGVLAAPLFCLAGIFLITAGTDECWILSGVRGLAEHGSYGLGSPFRSVHSTGGAYTLVMTVLYKLGGGRVEILRLASVACFAALLFTLYRWSGRVTGRKDVSGWITPAALFAVPGSFMLGSQAYGEVMATLLMMAGATLWMSLPEQSWGRRLAVGVLLGTAAATRLNCLVALVALPLSALFSGAKRKTDLIDAAVACIAGGIAFSLLWKVLWWLSADPASAAASQASFSRSSAWHQSIGYALSLLLNYWAVARDFLPFFLVAMVTVGWFLTRPHVADSRGGTFLLIAGWLMWGAWIVQSPIPHLRYLWPGLACFAAVAGIELAVLYQKVSASGPPGAKQGLLLLSLGFLVTGYMEGARTMERGDGDVLSWEWHRATAHSLQFGSFRAIRSQKSFVQRLKQIPEQDRIASAGFDTALSYLTRRPVYHLGCYYPDRADRYGDYLGIEGLRGGPMPRWIIVTPYLYLMPSCQLNPPLQRWIEQNCRLADKFGPYALYEVTGSFPTDSEVLELDTWTPRLPLVPKS